MTAKTRRTLRFVSLICLIVAMLLAVAIVAGMLYLQRGSYDPLDSLVLIAVCMMAQLRIGAVHGIPHQRMSDG